MSCSTCSFSQSEYTSVRCNDNSSRPSFDVNRRGVKAFNAIGKGYAAMETFCMTLNMNCMSHSVFDSHVVKIHSAAIQSADQLMERARKEVREKYIEIDNKNASANVINIAVSFDGTWQRRGHTSLYGVACVIDVQTGFVLDYEVLSKYCQACKVNQDLGVNTPEYNFWLEGHKCSCEANYSGSSPAMEMTAALTLWQRSEQHGFRYSTMVSDGDSKTYKHLLQNKVYGGNIKKEECINHVAKRMGTALRNLVKDERTRGTTLGGRSHGSLKDSTITNISKYYRNAMYQHKGDKEGMKNAIYAILYHCRSTDEKPDHRKCPQGEDSWCFFN